MFGPILIKVEMEKRLHRVNDLSNKRFFFLKEEEAGEETQNLWHYLGPTDRTRHGSVRHGSSNFNNDRHEAKEA